MMKHTNCLKPCRAFLSTAIILCQKLRSRQMSNLVFSSVLLYTPVLCADQINIILARAVMCTPCQGQNKVFDWQHREESAIV